MWFNFRYKPSPVKLIQIYHQIPLNKLISDILHIRASADTDCLIHEPSRQKPSDRKPPLNFLWLFGKSTAKTATSVKRVTIIENVFFIHWTFAQCNLHQVPDNTCLFEYTVHSDCLTWDSLSLSHSLHSSA